MKTFKRYVLSSLLVMSLFVAVLIFLRGTSHTPFLKMFHVFLESIYIPEKNLFQLGSFLKIKSFLYLYGVWALALVIILLLKKTLLSKTVTCKNSENFSR